MSQSRFISLLMVVLLSGPIAGQAVTQADQKVSFDMVRQPLGDALRQFGQVADLQIVLYSEVSKGLMAPRLEGEFTTQTALERLLENTGLRFEYLNAQTVAILPREAAANDAPALTDKNFRLAQVDSPATGAASAASQTIDEIVVTAQKREERLQDVPVPVTVVSATSLIQTNQSRLQDYYTKVPGLSLSLFGDGGAPRLGIRGITTGGSTNPTVGIVVDEILYGSTTSQGGGNAVPDIDPSDLARVEVLRGPQGTLYGANSIGGLLKFVTVDPSSESFSGRVQAGFSGTHESDEVGYSVRGAVNVPLTEATAVRLSAFTSRLPGYVDNARTNQEDVNGSRSSGGRIVALMQLTDAASIKLTALFQNSERFGPDELNSTRLGLASDQLIGTSGYERKTQVYSALLKAKLGVAELVSATGFSIDGLETKADVSSAFASLTTPNFGAGTGTQDPFHRETKKFTQELRLTVPLTERVEWLAGGFYTHEDVSNRAEYFAVNATTGAELGNPLNLDTPSSFEELAAFSDVTLKFGANFDVQLGGRISRNDQTFSQTRSGITPFVTAFYGIPPRLILPEVTSKETAFTYLVTPRYKIAPDLMVYGRFASGYRPGGPNTTCTATFPCAFESDKTKNYEIGLKGNVLDRLLSFDASLYYIDWTNIQLSLRDPVSASGYTGNGSKANSRGVELSLNSNPWSGGTLSGWVSYNDAALSESLPATSTVLGLQGDRLPYSSRWSGNLSIEQEVAITSSVAGFAGGSLAYVGERVGIFRSTAVRSLFPSYKQFDVFAGVKYRNWSVNGYVTNLTDERGVLRGQFDAAITSPAVYYSYIQPRSYGLTLTMSY